MGAAITAVSSSTTVTLASAASTAVTTAPAVYMATMMWWRFRIASMRFEFAARAVLPPFPLRPTCFLPRPAGWWRLQVFQIPTHANIAGSEKHVRWVDLFSPEYNGDLFSLTTGTSSLYTGQPVSGVTVSNLGIYTMIRPSLQDEGFHINSAARIYGFGGMYYTHSNNIDGENAALGCLSQLDGHTNSTDNPNPIPHL